MITVSFMKNSDLSIPSIKRTPIRNDTGKINCIKIQGIQTDLEVQLELTCFTHKISKFFKVG